MKHKGLKRSRRYDSYQENFRKKPYFFTTKTYERERVGPDTAVNFIQSVMELKTKISGGDFGI